MLANPSRRTDRVTHQRRGSRGVTLVEVLIVVAILALNAGGVAIYAIPQIIAGPKAAGRWVGIQNAVGGDRGHAIPSVERPAGQ